MTKLSTVLDQVDNGTIQLPEFQRGYVWNRDQVRGLMKSVYRDYPVGALLVWETDTAADQTRGGPLGGSTGQKTLLLDGQQRVTSLYGVIRGRTPQFFDGDPKAFTDLYFNVESEEFLFYAVMRMKNDPRWVNVTALFVEGTEPVFQRLMESGIDMSQMSTYFKRLQKLEFITFRDFHIEQITGPDKTIDVVVDIFNRVNSGGTKLSKGDLALARICSEWKDARPWMRTYLDGWKASGFSFTLDWVLRNATAVATGRAPFSALEDVSAAQFEAALKGSKDHIDHLLTTVLERFGLDHDQVLFGTYAFPVLARILSARREGRFADAAEANRAMAWYAHSALLGRFSGSAETNLNKDLQTADTGGVDALLESLRKAQKGSLAVRPEDLDGVRRGSRPYSLLYLLTRAVSGRDLLTGETFDRTVRSLHVQEIFPRDALHAAGFSRNEVNAVANFAFVTHDTGMRLGDRLPQEHLADCSPHGLRAQWVPEDRSLWTIERYPEFLAARRALLADAADRFLASLADGSAPWPSPPLYGLEAPPDITDPGARAAQIKALLDEFADLGFAVPMVDCDVPDLLGTGQVLAHAEAFWPEGLQTGQDKAIVLELDPEEADLGRLAENDCLVFTSVDSLRSWALRRVAAQGGDTRDEGTNHPASSVDPAPPEGPQEPEAPRESALEDEFDDAVRGLMDRSTREVRYNPSHLRLLVSQHGAVGTARRLLTAPGVSDGFVKLWELRRLDLTVEAVVIETRFDALFTDSERRVARSRLDDFGWPAGT